MIRKQREKLFEKYLITSVFGLVMEKNTFNITKTYKLHTKKILHTYSYIMLRLTSTVWVLVRTNIVIIYIQFTFSRHSTHTYICIYCLHIYIVHKI